MGVTLLRQLSTLAGLNRLREVGVKNGVDVRAVKWEETEACVPRIRAGA